MQICQSELPTSGCFLAQDADNGAYGVGPGRTDSYRGNAGVLWRGNFKRERGPRGPLWVTDWCGLMYETQSWI